MNHDLNTMTASQRLTIRLTLIPKLLSSDWFTSHTGLYWFILCVWIFKDTHSHLYFIQSLKQAKTTTTPHDELYRQRKTKEEKLLFQVCRICCIKTILWQIRLKCQTDFQMWIPLILTPSLADYWLISALFHCCYHKCGNYCVVFALPHITCHGLRKVDGSRVKCDHFSDSLQHPNPSMKFSKLTLAAIISSLSLVATGFFLLVFNVQLLQNGITKVITPVAQSKEKACFNWCFLLLWQGKVLSQGNDAYESWEHIPAPLFFHVYVFNITNADEVASGSEHIQLQEVGPYVFQDHREKIIYEDDGESITYLPRSLFEFIAERSGNLSLDDSITTVNVPLVVCISTPTIAKGWLHDNRSFDCILKTDRRQNDTRING